MKPRPKGIAAQVRVRLRAKGPNGKHRIGTVKDAVRGKSAKGGKTWSVIFDDGGVEVVGSASLAINESSYENASSTPKKNAIRVDIAQPKTGLRVKTPEKQPRSLHPSSETPYADDDDLETPRPGPAAADSPSTTSTDSSLRSDSEVHSPNLSVVSSTTSSDSSPAPSVVNSVKKKLKNIVAKNRKHAKPTAKPVRLSFDLGHTGDDDDCFMAEEGGCFDDRYEESEDDLDSIDEPQKNKKYQKAKEMSRKEKSRLVRDNHTIRVKVSARNTYEVDGRVEIKKGDHKGMRGTIIKVIEEKKRFEIEWDNGQKTEAEYSQLVLVKDADRSFTWRVVEDHDPANPPSKYDRKKCGVVGFRPELFRITDVNDPNYAFPFGRLLQDHLWPGHWPDQLDKLNVAIRKHNEALGRGRIPINECSTDEFWTFIGIIILAGKTGYGGVSKMFGGEESIIEGVSTTDMSQYMRKYRMKQLLEFFSNAFSGDNEEDKWNQIRGFVDGFNENRNKVVAASEEKVLDETMSAWSPTTTKHAGLPFLSFIMRKPEPLGTEFKTVADAVTGIFLYLELQEGKDPMRSKPHSRKLGGTGGCSIRLIEGSQYSGQLEDVRMKAKNQSKRETYFGDSWFTSRRIIKDGLKSGKVTGLGPHEYAGILKTNHSGTPKLQVEEIMKDWPAGSYLVLICDELAMMFIGYKYSYKRKPIFMLASLDAGSTRPGEPYKAKWPDANGNIKSRDVIRPDIMGRFFKRSNVIDVGNQLRQKELALEKHWLTHDPYFRIGCTIIGISVIDAYLAAKYQAPECAGITKMSVREWAERMAYDLLNRKITDEPKASVPLRTSGAAATTTLISEEGVEIELHHTLTIEDAMVEHDFRMTSQRGQDNKRVRRVCHMKGRIESCEGQTSKVTTECQHPLCLGQVGSKANRHAPPTGIFICSNAACRRAHWRDMVGQVNHCRRVS